MTATAAKVRKKAKRSNASPTGERFFFEGAPVFVEPAPGLPLIDFVVCLRGGAGTDPEDALGTTRLMARLLRRGWRGAQPSSVDEQLDRLGARLSITLGQRSIRISATVLARNFEPLVALLARLVREPAFRNDDLARAKRRIRAALHAMRDDDGALAHRHLRNHLFGDHPLGRPVGGTHASLGRIDRTRLIAQHRTLLRRDRVLYGAAGAVDAEEVAAVLARHFSDLPKDRSKGAPKVPTPKMARGRRVRIIDKPDRAQTQLGIATLGTWFSDPHRMPLVVADAAFGGLFTSRLSHQVRTVHGYSYSTYSSLSVGLVRDAWEMWSHPATERLADCAELQLRLLDEWAAEGLRAREVGRAKQWLIRGRCFDEDTAAKRLDMRLERALRVGRTAPEPIDRFRSDVRAVNRRTASEAVAKRIQPRDLAIVAVGDRRLLEPALSKLGGVTEVEVRPHTDRL